MARKPKTCAEKGSTKWLQLAVNKHPDLINEIISSHLQPNPDTIEWLSPIECDDYAEYSDYSFIERLGLELRSCPLVRFWPTRGGPNWDGLAKTDISQVLLVEAKAHVGELREKGSTASRIKSIDRINCSLEETQNFLGADMLKDWSKRPHYQYANRLAHLYLLSEKNYIDAYLLMVYFLNDEDMEGPDSIGQWEAAIRTHHEGMGLCQDHRKSDRIIDLYLDVRVFGE